MRTRKTGYERETECASAACVFCCGAADGDVFESVVDVLSGVSVSVFETLTLVSRDGFSMYVSAYSAGVALASFLSLCCVCSVNLLLSMCSSSLSFFPHPVSFVCERVPVPLRVCVSGISAPSELSLYFFSRVCRRVSLSPIVCTSYPILLSLS